MDCKTILFILGIIFGWRLFIFADKHFAKLYAAGLLWMRLSFGTLMLIALALGGFTGEEIFIGAAWAMFELLANKMQPEGEDNDESESA